MPVRRLGTVLRHTLPVQVHVAQGRLGRGVSLLRGFFIPLGGLLQIFRHPLAMVIQETEAILGLNLPPLCRLFVT